MKLSVIGSGRWGQLLIRKFHDLGGVHLVYGHRNREVLEPLGIRFTEDLAQLIAQSDAVVVATPPQTHYEVARQVLAAGRDLFLEKPMTLYSAEAEELARLAEEGERVLLVGHVLCYSEAVRQFQALGTPVRAEAVFWKTSTQEQYLNAVWNFGPHIVALALVLGLQPEQLEFSTDDAAPHDQRTFPLFARREDGTETSLTWDFLAPGRREDMVRREGEHFLECCRTRQRPLTDGWHGVEVVRWLERISPVRTK